MISLIYKVWPIPIFELIETLKISRQKGRNILKCYVGLYILKDVH